MSMTSRQRLQNTLDHKPVDRICVDFGGTAVTGISVVALTQLRRALLGQADYRVKVIEPYQMLGEIDDELGEALGIDVLNVGLSRTMFGFDNKDWKPFTLFDGTEVLVPGDFNVTPAKDGGWLIYPEGDTSAAPSGWMPEGGYYFDALCRQDPIDDAALDPAHNLEEFGPMPDEDIQSLVARAHEVQARGMGSTFGLPGTAFGDIALVPAMWKKQTPGIRDVQDWYMSTLLRRDYVYEVFEGQCEIALNNIERLASALGDSVQAAFVTGTDFGTQRGLFISVEAYRDLYKPFHKIINDYVHAHTPWKTFIHSCGAVFEMIPEFIDAGFDILNPVQCSACGMDPVQIKREFGKDLVFWGGGVDTQKTLPFGTPDAVYREVRERIRIFGEGSGFVFNTIHNIQSNTPVENMLAMFKAIADSHS